MIAPEAAKTGRPAGGSMRSGFLRLMFSQVLLKMLGLGREAVIAFFFKVSAASNYYFMIRGINESMLSVISGNTLGGVFIPRMSHDEQGRVRFSEIRKLTRFGWIVGGLLALITMPLQFYFFFRRGAAFQEFHTDLLWVIFWLGICIIFISYNAFAGVLLQSVGDFRALSNLSLIIGFGLMAGPLICRNAFGFSGITLARLLTLLLGAAYLAWALRRVRDRFSPLDEPHAESGFDWKSLETWVMLTNLITSNYFTVWYAVTKAALGGHDVNSYFNYAFLMVNSLYGIVLVPLSTVLLPMVKRAKLEGRAHNLPRIGWLVLGLSLAVCLGSLPFMRYMEPLFRRVLRFPEIHAQGVATTTAGLLWVLPGAALQVVFSQYIFVNRGRRNLWFNLVTIALSVLYTVLLALSPSQATLFHASLGLFIVLGAASALFGLTRHEPREA